MIHHLIMFEHVPLNSIKIFVLLNFAFKICDFEYNLIYYEYKYAVDTYY